MPTAEPTRWYSLHIHRYDEQDRLLLDAVVPLLDRLRPDGHFFLRYWKGGHHVRLRLRGPAGLADTAAEALRDHCARHPAGAGFDVAAFRQAQLTMAALEDEQTDDIQPPDTVRAAEYQPEFDKYGGPAGVAAAERFFQVSSDAVLAELPRLVDHPARRLGTAFATMLRSLTAAGHTPADTARFFADYCLLWSPYVFDAFLATWPRLLSAHAPGLSRHAAALLASAEPGPVGTAVRSALNAADHEVLAAITLAGPGAPPRRRRQVLLTGYLHTHNNRLGLIPQQEALLGYLGHHVLSAQAGLRADPTLMDRLTRHRAARLALA
ncbi:thiopeptide-type bacteriocin biosynthesis protein [Actinoplanes xinjiangensis]|uniref:thiopeptide-type bacteriocin biosynthesis protein n=1 Tax=Actinoplanes xinjiangensis TaxID=512350 RepID=UPI0034444F67